MSVVVPGQEAAALVLLERQRLEGDARHGPRLAARQALLQVSTEKWCFGHPRSI